MSEPTYLVRTSDDRLHAYWHRDILLIDLAKNRGEQVTIYKIRKGMGQTHYEPITEELIRKVREIA